MNTAPMAGDLTPKAIQGAMSRRRVTFPEHELARHLRRVRRDAVVTMALGRRWVVPLPLRVVGSSPEGPHDRIVQPSARPLPEFGTVLRAAFLRIPAPCWKTDPDRIANGWRMPRLVGTGRPSGVDIWLAAAHHRPVDESAASHVVGVVRPMPGLAQLASRLGGRWPLCRHARAELDPGSAQRAPLHVCLFARNLLPVGGSVPTALGRTAFLVCWQRARG